MTYNFVEVAMGRRKKERASKRVTLYIDEQIHDDVRALAERLDMSLSRLTRLLYVFSLGLSSLVDEVQQHERELHELYPDGVPEDEQAALVQHVSQRWQATSQRWGNYLSGLLAGAGLASTNPPSAEEITPQQVLAHAVDQLEGLQHLRELAGKVQLDATEDANS